MKFNLFKKKQQRIGICLSGGGARGIAHIGVLKALEEHDIYPEGVSGASMGAIVGAMYAAGKSAEETLDIINQTKLYKLFSLGIPVSGLSELQFLRKQMQKHLPDNSFESLQRKLFVAISNLNTGQCEILDKGELHSIIEASASIPLIFKPVKIGNYTYVDGGLLNNLPVEPLVEAYDLIIGVNVNPNVINDMQWWNMVEVGERCFDLVMWRNALQNLQKCHIMIEPPDTLRHTLFDFGSAQKIFRYGYEATLTQIPKILEKIR
jgi:NTE family protein